MPSATRLLIEAADMCPNQVAFAKRRRLAFVALVGVISFAYLYLWDSSRRGDIELHTLVEVAAAALAMAVGCLALVRYYSTKDTTFRFIGAGFVCTAFLDAYHAVVTSPHFIQTFPSSPPALMVWSGFASRMFLSLLLWLSWLFWRREMGLGAAGHTSGRLVYATVAVLALACYGVFAFVPMPPAYYPSLFFPRPQEFVPALFLGLALVGYLRKGKWEIDVFEYWLVLSLIVGLMGQAMFMSRSAQPYDPMFAAGHLLKIVSYVCAMSGLLFSMPRLFGESLAQHELAFANTILATQQEVSPDGILVVDEHAKIVSYNRRFVDLWGLPQTLVSARLDEPVLQWVVTQVREPEAFVSRVKYLYEHRTDESHEEIALKDGRVIDRHSAPLLGEDGRYFGRVWFFRDISSRRRAEQAVVEERVFSDTIIASMPDAFCVFDTAGKLVRWNPRMTEMLGVSDAELAGTANGLEIVEESDRPAVAETIREVFEHGAGMIDAHVITKSGIRLFSMKATRADTRKNAYLVGVGSDITEHAFAEEKVRRSDAHLAEAQRISHVGSWEQDHVANTVNWSAEAFRIFERDPASCVPSFGAFLAIVHPDDRVASEEGFTRSLREHKPYEFEHRLLMKDGRIKHVHEQGSTIYDEQGRPLRTLGTVHDITDRILAQRQIKLFRVLIDSAVDEIQVVDPVTLRIVDANESAWAKLGYTRDELLALRANDIDTSDDETRGAIGERLLKDGSTIFETRHVRKDGSTFPVEITLHRTTLDRPYAIAIARDITERKRVEEAMRKMQEQLRDQAVHDSLTGLYNRRYLDETMGRELLRAARYGQPAGIVMCDLDHFKAVNDAYGHLAGDAVLRAFAELLKSNTRGSDVACRYGGEEFVLLLPNAPPDVAYERAEQLRSELAAKRIPFGDFVLRINASLGVAGFPQDGKTGDELIRAADEAMYAAKLAGRNRVVVASAVAATAG